MSTIVYIEKNGLSKKDEEEIYKYFFKKYKDKSTDRAKSAGKDKSNIYLFLKKYDYLNKLRELFKDKLVYPFCYSEEEDKRYLKVFLAFNIIPKILYDIDKKALLKVKKKDKDAIVDFYEYRFGNSKKLFQELKKQIVKKINKIDRELEFAMEDNVMYPYISPMYNVLFAESVDIKLKEKALNALLEFIELGIKYPNLILKMYY